MRRKTEIIHWSNKSAIMWDKFVSQFSTGSIFHSPQWIQTISQAYGGEPLLVLVKEGSNLISGAPIVLTKCMSGRQLISLPYSDYCNPLYTDQSALTDMLLFLNNSKITVQLRDGYGTNVSSVIGFTHKNKLACLTEQQLFSKFSKKSVQQCIRRAENNCDLEILKSTTLTELRVFYDLLVHTRRRQENLVQPWEYFVALHEYVICRDKGFVITARYKGKPIASAVFLYSYQTMTYKYSASLPSFWKLAPNHIILWNALKCALSMGLGCFDWGRTGVHHESLRRFKLHWSAEEQLLSYVFLGPCQSDRVLLAKLVRHKIGKVQKMLPSSFSSNIFSKLLRYYP